MRYCVLLCIFSINFLIILSVAAGKCLVPDELIPELYSKYKSAITSGASVSLRRLLTENREYKIHVQKLKEVNGYKRHNLKIKEVARNGSPLNTFYINNPLEAKMPNAFLSYDEFKDALSNRANLRRSTKKYVTTKRRKLLRSQKNKSIPIRRTVNMSGTRAIKLVKHSRGKLFLKRHEFNKSVVNKNATYFPPVNSTKFNNKAVIKPILRVSNKKATKNKKDVKIIKTISKKNSKSNDTTVTANVTKNDDQEKKGEVTKSTSEVKNLRSNDASTTAATVSETDVSTMAATASETDVTTTVATVSETDVTTTVATVSETEVSATEATVTETDTEAVTTVAEAELSTEPTTTKRSTLARPLVFMGGNK